MLQNSGIFHDSTHPYLHFDTEIAAILRLYIKLRVRYKNNRKKHSCFGLAWSRPRVSRGLSRPTSDTKQQ